MTPQDIITEARYVLSDTNSTGVGYRQGDTELLGYVNSSLVECAVLRPELFATIGDMTCVVGQCEQSLDYADAIALLEVLSIHQGAALTPFDMAAMTAYNPNWRTDTGAAARQWSRFQNDPLKFFIYPKAPAAAQVLDVRYARNPATFTINATITDVPLALKTALVEYVIYRAESKDDEHVSSGRTTSYYQAFLAKVKG